MAGIFTKLSRCYQLGLLCHLGELVVTHLPAHHSLGLLGISQVGRISVTSGEERRKCNENTNSNPFLFFGLECLCLLFSFIGNFIVEGYSVKIVEMLR